MAVAEPRFCPQFGAPSCPDESYTPLLQESVHHLLLQLRAGASNLSHFHMIFSRLVQTAPSPPVEIIWFYGAVNFHSHKAIFGHRDPEARLAALKDLFHLLVAACSESCTALKRIAVLAPLVFQLYNLVLGLNSCFHGGVCDEIASLLDRIVSFISMCCCGHSFAHDNSPALSCCFPDLVRVWTFELCEQHTEYADYFKVFFPAVSEEVHNRLRESCGVGYLAGAVMFQCFLLRLCLNLGSRGTEMQSSAGDMVNAFRSCYFFGILMEMLLEPTFCVTSLLSRDDEVLVQKALFDAIILLDYPISLPESECEEHACSNHLKRLALSWLFVAGNALSFLRQHLDNSRADAYAGALFKSVSHSRLMNWLVHKLCIEEKVVQRVLSSPSVLFDWISELHSQVSDPDIRELIEKVERFRSRPNSNFPTPLPESGNDLYTNNFAYLQMAPSVPGFNFCLEADVRRRKRKDMTDGEMGLQFKTLKYQICDDSFGKPLPFQNGNGWITKNELETPVHDEDMEIIVQ